MDNQVVSPSVVTNVVSWSNLLSGLCGALIGSIISTIAALRISKKSTDTALYISNRQMQFQSNRMFLEKLVTELQNIHNAIDLRTEITNDSIKEISSFEIIPYEEFNIVRTELSKLKAAIFRYKDGREKTSKTTTTSPEEIDASRTVKELINKILIDIRAIT